MGRASKGKLHGWAEQQVIKRLTDGWSGDPWAMGPAEVTDMLRGEHARAVRIVRRAATEARPEWKGAWWNGYRVACKDILEALQRGRTGGGAR